MRTLLLSAVCAVVACSDQSHSTAPASSRTAESMALVNDVAPSLGGGQSAAKATYLSKVVYADSVKVIPAGLESTLDAPCPPGTSVVGGGFFLTGGSAREFTKVIASFPYGPGKWRVHATVDAASQYGEPLYAYAICIG